MTSVYKFFSTRRPEPGKKAANLLTQKGQLLFKLLKFSPFSGTLPLLSTLGKE
jgi:hypothetical protein